MQAQTGRPGVSDSDSKATRPKQITGVERTFDPDEIIVSKTDLQGRITYVNGVFVRVSGFTERELVGSPHSVIRHPEMPRCIFELLWSTIQDKREFFGYVNNLSKNGDNYWVLAHVTPSINGRGDVVGYHSNRRTPDRHALDEARALYGLLLDEERRHGSKTEAVAASRRLLTQILAKRGQTYEEWVWSITSA